MRQKHITPAAISAALDGNLGNFKAASTPGGIERQEANGQKALIESAMLPKEIRGATREQLQAIGFEFGEDVDDLFVNCKLPPGWAKQATEHPMHSNIVDQNGTVRARIFYKAAFYDRRADMMMTSRYTMSAFDEGSTEDQYATNVRDSGSVLKRFGEAGRTDYDKLHELEAKASKWLDEHFPDWRNPMAYWENLSEHEDSYE